ncbi:hypothetical protein ACX8XP_17890 [Calditrichota bacterium LG25]
MTKQKNKIDEKEEKVLQELLDLLEKLSIHVRYDRGFFNGGLVRYKDQLYLYLNRKADSASKIALIVEELKYIHIPENLLSDNLKTYFQLKN